MHAGPVFNGDAGGNFSRSEQTMIRRSALNLSVVVRAAASGKESQAIQRPQAIGEGIREPLFEPADRPGTDARQNDPRFPRIAQDFYHTPIAPQGKQTFGVAAADVDDLLIE